MYKFVRLILCALLFSATLENAAAQSVVECPVCGYTYGESIQALSDTLECCTCIEECWETGPEDGTPYGIAVSLKEPTDIAVPPPSSTPADTSFFLLKTNTLYWLGLVPNLSLEVPVGRNWTVAGRYHHSWWKRDEVNWIWKTYGGQVAVRKYFGKNSFRFLPGGEREYGYTRHHLGLNLMLVTYHFNMGGPGDPGSKGILARRPTLSAGLEYGYTWPVTDHFRIDLNVGAGYVRGVYEEYIPMDGHYVWKATKMRNYFGVTELELSLIWKINLRKRNVE